MKKILTGAIVITICAVLCADLWMHNDQPDRAPIETQTPTVNTKTVAAPAIAVIMQETPESNIAPVNFAAEPTAQEKNAIPPEEEKPMPEELPVQVETLSQVAAVPQSKSTDVPQSGDPYHTDVYPNNVYSEKLIYNSDGELIGKTYTIPTMFGSDTIWIDGHAYYDVPGFGLVEWGGPSQRTEDYIMYESGVKVGIMGGEDEAPASSTHTGYPSELPIPIEETIDQTINVRPERNSTPPDYKPELTPPTDPNARDRGCSARWYIGDP